MPEFVRELSFPNLYYNSDLVLQSTKVFNPDSGQNLVMLKIGSVVINCKDFDKTYKFWQEALHYHTREKHPTPDFVILRDPKGAGPNVSVQETDELKFGRNRMHLDLYATDQKAEVERLVKLGATVHRLPKEGQDFVIMADPEGKLFCVVQI